MHDRGIIKLGEGEIGGKGTGFINAQKILNDKKSGFQPEALVDNIAFPQTVLVTTEFFSRFVEDNKLKSMIEEVEHGPHNEASSEQLKNAILEGSFTEEMSRDLCSILDSFPNPIVVRSSSLLEDQKGAAFAGKYESIFLGNQGTKMEKEGAFLNAVKRVYSSTYNPSAIAYRHKHGFLQENEQMALLVQEVVGTRYEKYYLPAMAGVGFSQNGYCWNKEINKSDGLVRLVFGLGTRAVGRGYVRLFSPTKPSMRPEGTEVNNIQKCSQKNVDVVDLEQNVLKTVHFRELVQDGFKCFPGSQPMISLRDGAHLYRPISNLWNSQHIQILTMDGVLSSLWMNLDIAKTLECLLKGLEENLKYAVDVEFAVNYDFEKNKANLYILQVRSLSEKENGKPVSIPDLKNEDLIFSIKSNIPTAYVPDIEYLVYVDDIAYHNWPYREKQSVARVIGKLNEALKGKRFALIEPGRWGSWNSELGVPVNYAEISNCVLLVEIARRCATYVPEVSFGSHFFRIL
ncbi:MAG: hypothetical protein COS89_08495 [Deltaproteobacteria bacterium CG07_land_8_20_14_0_80_38_7]|nr:MAG: hypothetical protein COS89_08495 [Deltaproteobacteria bacterium CG07_land_8_20_14_0_80_38_7]